MNQSKTKTKRNFTMKRIAWAAPTKWVRDLIKQLREAGYTEVSGSISTGLVKVLFEGDVILEAVQINRGHWAVKGAQEVMTPEA